LPSQLAHTMRSRSAVAAAASARTVIGQRSDSSPRHGGLIPVAQGVAMITVHVPAMTVRHDVRAISAVISDVPGVQTLRADLVTGTVQVTGSADPAAITAAITAAGYTAVDDTVAPSTAGSPPTGTARTGPAGAHTRRHARSEDVRSTPTLGHRPDTHHRRSRRSP
jgi:copper chaperone CopZ